MTFQTFFTTSFLIYHRLLNSAYLLRQQFSYNKFKKVQNFINLLIQPHRCRMIDIFETSWSKQWSNNKVFHCTFTRSCFQINFCYILIHWRNQNFMHSHQQLENPYAISVKVCFYKCWCNFLLLRHSFVLL